MCNKTGKKHTQCFKKWKESTNTHAKHTEGEKEEDCPRKASKNAKQGGPIQTWANCRTNCVTRSSFMGCPVSIAHTRSSARWASSLFSIAKQEMVAVEWDVWSRAAQECLVGGRTPDQRDGGVCGTPPPTRPPGSCSNSCHKHTTFV